MNWFKTWSLLKPNAIYLMFPISDSGIVSMLSCGWSIGSNVIGTYREGCFVALEAKAPKLEECL